MTKTELIERIRMVATIMAEVGAEMNYFGGLNEIGQHGLEMLGASRIASGWADGFENEGAEDANDQD